MVTTFITDPGIEYAVIEPSRSPEIPALPQSIIPQELDKHDYTLIGRKNHSMNKLYFDLKFSEENCSSELLFASQI